LGAAPQNFMLEFSFKPTPCQAKKIPAKNPESGILRIIAEI